MGFEREALSNEEQLRRALEEPHVKRLLQEEKLAYNARKNRWEKPKA